MTIAPGTRLRKATSCTRWKADHPFRFRDGRKERCRSSSRPTAAPSNVYHPQQTVARVSLLELSSGRRTPWKELKPFDAAGLGAILSVAIAPDAKSYAYDYAQMLSDLYLVEGLR